MWSGTYNYIQRRSVIKRGVLGAKDEMEVTGSEWRARIGSRGGGPGLVRCETLLLDN